MDKKLMKKYQEKVYNGRAREYVPVYADKKSFCVFLSRQIIRAKEQGVLGYSLKSIKNTGQINKLGIKKGMKVLDAGCGPGTLINQVRALSGADCFGADISALAIKRAKECGDKKIKYVKSQLEKLPYKSNFFDRVLSFDVLEHVEDQKKSLSELLRVTKPGGKILIYAVSRRDYFTWHWFQRLLTFGKLGVDREGGHFRENFVRPGAVKEFLKNRGIVKYKIGYFHSFFTLIIDEFLFRIQKSKAPGGTSKAAVRNKKAGLKIKVFLFLISCVLFTAELLETPWKLFGFSNGFFVAIDKK